MIYDMTQSYTSSFLASGLLIVLAGKSAVQQFIILGTINKLLEKWNPKNNLGMNGRPRILFGIFGLGAVGSHHEPLATTRIEGHSGRRSKVFIRPLHDTD